MGILRWLYVRPGLIGRIGVGGLWILSVTPSGLIVCARIRYLDLFPLMCTTGSRYPALPDYSAVAAISILSSYVSFRVSILYLPIPDSIPTLTQPRSLGVISSISWTRKLVL